MPAPAPDVLLCFACRRLGACRLGITHETLVEPGVSQTQLACARDYEGGPGVSHGGWTAEVMDEALGHLNILGGGFAVTATLNVEFLRPVPLERPLVIRAWSETVENGRRTNAGELSLISTGVVLARARGVYVDRDASHFQRHAAWLAEQDAAGRPDEA
jgi:acyl-coenzyme A thioesterase PaaI-like protein